MELEENSPPGIPCQVPDGRFNYHVPLARTLPLTSVARAGKDER